MAFLLNSQCFISWAAPDPCPTSEMRENLGKDLQDVCWDLMPYSLVAPRSHKVARL